MKEDQFKKFLCLLSSSMIQAIADNPFTSYRQLLQQYTKDINGNYINPSLTNQKVRKIFLKNPINVAFSGLKVRLIGNFIKRVPKFGLILGYNGNKKNIGLDSILFAAIFASPFVNPVRFIEKQQRINLDKCSKEVSAKLILKKCKNQYYLPLFRGMIPLISHTFISTSLGIFYQNKIQQNIYKKNLFNSDYGNRLTSNILSSVIISPLYITLTNPIERIETMIQVQNIEKPKMKINNVINEYIKDVKLNGLKGFLRGQGAGIGKAVVSLTVFHETRMSLENILIKK